MAYRFDELGWLQFERLCMEVLALESGVAPSDWDARRGGIRSSSVARDIRVPGTDRTARGPVLVVARWVPSTGGPERVRNEAVGTVLENGTPPPASLVELTNRAENPSASARAYYVGPEELGHIVDSRPELRYRMPSLLGIRDLDVLIPADLVRRSTVDVEAARNLARVFVATRAYARTLEVLRRHHFAVVTGPPEMGKTAIARMIGLAALTDGWELHECLQPDELWAALARDRRQLFVADDAFGSTEYRPEAAERWALDLDRVLRAMDERHRLIWTSRPTPLKAGLRRIHREHGVERFPQPAQVHVAADELDVEEKALILFRHAQSAALPADAVAVVRTHGWEIVDHAHFTPERIRRFVGGRLRDLAPKTVDVAAAVRAEIREPTEAMAESFHALPDEYRALLVALLDASPGVVDERELGAVARQHSDTLPRPAHELVDRLTDHFVRIVPPDGVTWVHPSWRDLVIDELARDEHARRRFLSRCSLEGLLLGLSVGGGAGGGRRFPLIGDDADWDAVAARMATLVPELDDPAVFRLLASLRTAREASEDPREAAEVDALATFALDAVAQAWRGAHTPVPVTLLEAWFALAAHVADVPRQPDVAPTWIELLPTAPVDPASTSEVDRVGDWLRLAELLAERSPGTLAPFGFPGRQAEVLDALVKIPKPIEPDAAALLRRAVLRLARIDPARRVPALRLGARLARVAKRAEREAIPAATFYGAAPSDLAIVDRILSDLRPREGG